MSRFLSCLVLAVLANGCAISVGTAPATPAGAQIAYVPPPTYLPPPTAHSAPTPTPVQPALAPAAQPPAQPQAAPARRQPAAARADQPASRPVSPATGMRRTPAPAEPKTKQKLRFKDIWVEQTHPNTAPRMDHGPTPAGRLAS